MALKSVTLRFSTMPHADDMRPETLLSEARSGDPGGDPALWRTTVSGNEALALAIDTLISGVHFRAEAKSEDVAYKAVAVNLSDLAAMGAEPVSVAVALSAEKLSGPWIEGFRRGLARTARAFEVAVAAATLTRGPLSVSVEAIGRVPPDAALRRSGARPGDGIYVTGTLGDAGLGLAAAKGEISLPKDEAVYVVERLDRPQPRLAAGVALRGLASAAIDLSDGLAGDLEHILRASGVGASVQVDRLPLSPVMRSRRDGDSGLELALSFGDDYELCFTLPEAALSAFEKKFDQLGCSVTEIGVVEKRQGLEFRHDDGRPFAARAAYDHFRD
ncbi:MAG TPA: thiamine-phosphate kinase [Gammaproteobacteria bacterium]|nr:thiamine-phosphate kinase [Gammaproteobacteria bacterium]